MRSAVQSIRKVLLASIERLIIILLALGFSPVLIIGSNAALLLVLSIVSSVTVVVALNPFAINRTPLNIYGTLMKYAPPVGTRSGDHTVGLDQYTIPVLVTPLTFDSM